MATSTRTIFQAQEVQARQATVRGARQPQVVRMAVRERVEAAFTDRVERQVTNTQRQQWIEQPTLYAGNGLIKPLGAAGAMRPRGSATTGGFAAGDPVPSTQGIIGGMPSASAGADLALYRDLSTALGRVAFERGLQVRDLAYDDDTTPALARYPYDLHWNTETLELHYWKPSTEAEEGEWVFLTTGRDEISAYIEEPEAKTYPLIPYCTYPTKVLSLHLIGDSTATLSTATGGVLAVGDALNLTVSTAGSNPLAVTVGLAQVAAPPEEE